MDLKKIKQRIGRAVGEYLTYNRSEQRGILALNLVLLLLVVTNGMIPPGTIMKEPDFSRFSKDVRDFELAWRRAADSDSMVRVQKYLSYRSGQKNQNSDSARLIPNSISSGVIIELNAADTFDLQQLRGIGPGFARRIVGYRTRLRGYSDKRQVLEVFGMDSARYLAIEPNLRVNPDSVHPFDLNRVTIKDLIRHPYFPFAVAKNIMLYRQKNKVFKSLDEVRNIDGISDSLFRRISAYLMIGP